ncbi:MAG TPA: glycine cleavage system protein GcvH [Syntrophomonadaceae bacterium]|nr:glycine cleavage system protein GcvH [Syntrophomonadaceae bacterium]HQE22464.1 glycine cleavage system protein GcvH [Syntrophomonadaceae bacterium]
MKVPTNLLYTNEHEWLKVEGDRAILGITDFAQEHLGDIVFVELPELDAQVANGEAVAVVESVKAVASVYTPVSGKVMEINESLEDSPELLNQEPYEQFIAIIEMDDPSEVEELMTPEEYEQFCREQEQELG